MRTPEQLIRAECDELDNISRALELVGNPALAHFLAHVAISIRGNLDEMITNQERALQDRAVATLKTLLEKK